MEDLVAVTHDAEHVLGVAVDGGIGGRGFHDAAAQVRAEAVELLLEDGVVESGGGDGFRAGELLLELDAELVPRPLAGEGHGVAVEVVHGGSSCEMEMPRQGGA